MVYIAAFDPGRKNFAYCVERFQDDVLTELEIPDQKYNSNGTPTDSMQNILDILYTTGEVIDFDNINLLKSGQKAGNTIDQEVFNTLTQELNKRKEIWDKCDRFLIETQMSFGSNKNIPALKIAQHVYSYFVIQYGLDKVISDFPAYLKTQYLGAQKDAKKYKNGKVKFTAMSKPQRKKWAIQQAEHILELRQDDSKLKELFLYKKRDDVSDCLLMCQAGKIYYYLEK